MTEMPITGAIAEYRGKRYPIAFSSDEWVALRAEPTDDIPDSFASGDSPSGFGHRRPWVKVPRSTIDGIICVRARARLRGHTVSLEQQLPDGRVVVEFIGPPSVARELGMKGDQYMGWSGIFAPEELEDIRVEET
ncbi:hypothetical protein ACAG25_16325 [Mycobacterium sp. pV006]|uniref:hypothetical protein n=1 Tax=Mycobacterium sp. pV006 TaxID=3238983 RepID=UPI00351B814A